MPVTQRAISEVLDLFCNEEHGIRVNTKKEQWLISGGDLDDALKFLYTIGLVYATLDERGKTVLKTVAPIRGED